MSLSIIMDAVASTRYMYKNIAALDVEGQYQLSNSTVEDLFLVTRRLAHSSCSWPTQWTMYDQAVSL